MQKYTEKDEMLLNFIIEFEKTHLFPPSIREISEGVGVKSTSSIFHRLRKLEDFKKIIIDERGRISLVGYTIIEKRLVQISTEKNEDATGDLARWAKKDIMNV